MVKTYYVVLNADGQPATMAQRRKMGSRAYGYKTVAMAMRYCPSGAAVHSRFTEKWQDWPGNWIASK